MWTICEGTEGTRNRCINNRLIGFRQLDDSRMMHKTLTTPFGTARTRAARRPMQAPQDHRTDIPRRRFVCVQTPD